MSREQLKEHIHTWLIYMDRLPAYVSREDYLYGVLFPHIKFNDEDCNKIIKEKGE